MRRNKLKRWIKLLLWIIILLALLISYVIIFTNKPVKKAYNKITVTTTKKESNKITLSMVGDCLIHSYVYDDARQSDGTYSFDSMFTEVSN